MDVQLYKIEIMEGKEEIAEEWLSFLDKNKKRRPKNIRKRKSIF